MSAAYEPGSTFKVITVTGAIENGLATPDSVVDCQLGKILVAGRLIHDWKAFGDLTVREILEHSSDVGAIKLGLRLGSEKFYSTATAFGIGQDDGNRTARRKSWIASAGGELVGQLDRFAGHGAGGERDADPDYFRDIGGG